MVCSPLRRKTNIHRPVCGLSLAETSTLDNTTTHKVRKHQQIFIMCQGFCYMTSPKQWCPQTVKLQQFFDREPSSSDLGPKRTVYLIGCHGMYSTMICPENIRPPKALVTLLCSSWPGFKRQTARFRREADSGPVGLLWSC